MRRIFAQPPDTICFMYINTKGIKPYGNYAELNFIMVQYELIHTGIYSVIYYSLDCPKQKVYENMYDHITKGY